MRIDVLLNPCAGRIDAQKIEEQIRRVLFRCDLHFHYPESARALQEEILHSADRGVGSIVVCGGDGTVNTALQPLMKLRDEGREVPSLCIIPAGTANDLATQEKIPPRIDRVARAIMEGTVKRVDVLEVRGGGQVAYMVTNGGAGIAAEVAEHANVVRGWVRDRAEDPATPKILRPFLKMARAGIKRFGSRIYEVLLVSDVFRWQADSWEVEIDIPGKTSFTTRAPFILVNNQPAVGGKFVPAPFTSNSDGYFNVVLIQPTQVLKQARALLDMRMNRVPNVGDCPSFETQTLRLKATDTSRPITFFGDGEILLQKVTEITIRCLHPGVPIVKLGASSS